MTEMDRLTFTKIVNKYQRKYSQAWIRVSVDEYRTTFSIYFSCTTEDNKIWDSDFTFNIIDQTFNMGCTKMSLHVYVCV